MHLLIHCVQRQHISLEYAGLCCHALRLDNPRQLRGAFRGVYVFRYIHVLKEFGIWSEGVTDLLCAYLLPKHTQQAY